MILLRSDLKASVEWCLFTITTKVFLIAEAILVICLLGGERK